jgi:putative DNA primase/helicase
MEEDKELIDFLKTAIGWSLTGVVFDHALFILHGVGANGKSTFLNTISRMLGDYAHHTPTETLMSKDRYSIPADLARLKGARFVTAIEAEKGNKLAEALIKQMTGGDPITARFLYGNFFQFKPEFKLFLATNHKPNIAGGDHAIWRRIRLIPFNVVIPEKLQDKELPQKLENELPGILNWAIEGCREWQEKGLQTPKKVKATTAEYRDELDTIKTFIDECLRKSLRSETKASALYDRYKRWCEANGEFIHSQKVLGLRLTDRGHIRRKKRDGWYWSGLKLSGDG